MSKSCGIILTTFIIKISLNFLLTFVQILYTLSKRELVYIILLVFTLR
jgi:hypothetical protein